MTDSPTLIQFPAPAGASISYAPAPELRRTRRRFGTSLIQFQEPSAEPVWSGDGSDLGHDLDGASA